MHPDTLGWAAAALMVATFSCGEARLLRPLAVATNVAFIGYGLTASLLPVLVLHVALLPINLWRCAQAYGAGAKALGEAVERGSRVLYAIALASLPLLAGCGGGGDESSNPPAAAPSASTQPAPGTIGAAGGIVASGDGAEVSVPARALFSGLDSANDLLVQPDGRIVVGGSWRSGLSDGIALIRVIPWTRGIGLHPSRRN